MNGKLIIKIAVGVSVAAFLFSLITLVRDLSLGLPSGFPLIQFFGSTAILIVCFVMFYMMYIKGRKNEEEDTPEEEIRLEEPDQARAEEPIEDAEEAVDRLYEKYHLSDFE